MLNNESHVYNLGYLTPCVMELDDAETQLFDLKKAKCERVQDGLKFDRF